MSYDRFGAKVSQEYGNGITTDYNYNNVTRRLIGITATGNGTPMSQIQYAYDPVGNVTQVTSANPWLPSLSFSETFTYDASDQLVSASETQAQFNGTFSLDKFLTSLRQLPFRGEQASTRSCRERILCL